MATFRRASICNIRVPFLSDNPREQVIVLPLPRTGRKQRMAHRKGNAL
jgi:hypothetical protein